MLLKYFEKKFKIVSRFTSLETYRQISRSLLVQPVPSIGLIHDSRQVQVSQLMTDDRRQRMPTLDYHQIFAR